MLENERIVSRHIDRLAWADITSVLSITTMKSFFVDASVEPDPTEGLCLCSASPATASKLAPVAATCFLTWGGYIHVTRGVVANVRTSASSTNMEKTLYRAK